MKLSDLLQDLVLKNCIGTTGAEISNLCFDSRKVEQGSLFVAQKGTQSDGHQYIQQVIEKGAVAVVCQELPTIQPSGVCFLQVENSDEALGVLACNWYGNPSKKMQLVGVTGTNGKTTIATLLYEVFRKFGHKVGLLSTVCNYVDEEAIHATHTTPDALAINELLARMVSAGCEYAFMEVSSH